MRTKDQILSEMKGKSTTSKWDIVCCYRETYLNSFFSEINSNAQSKLFIENTCYDEILNLNITSKLNLNLKVPKIKFHAANKSCEFTIEIEDGEYSMTSSNNETTDIKIPKNTLQLVMNTPMTAIYGDMQKVSATEGVVSFDDDNLQTNVFLHITNELHTKFDIVPIKIQDENTKSNFNIQDYIITIIKSLIKTKILQIQYPLTQMIIPNDSKQIVLTPKAFIIRSNKPDNINDGVVYLYIQTTISGNDQGSFDPDTDLISMPIQDRTKYNYSTCFFSIILSSDLIIKILTSQYASLGWHLNPQSTQEGIKYSLSSDQVLNLEAYYDKEIEMGGGRYESITTPIHVNFGSNPINFNFQTNNKQINWSVNASYDWSCEETRAYSNGYTTINHGKKDSTMSLSKNFDYNISTKDNPIDLSFNLMLSQADIKLKTDELSTNINNHFQSKLAESINLFKFDIPSINIYPIANLIFSNTDMIYPGCNGTFYVPGDLILFALANDSGFGQVCRLGASNAKQSVLDSSSNYMYEALMNLSKAIGIDNQKTALIGYKESITKFSAFVKTKTKTIPDIAACWAERVQNDFENQANHDLIAKTYPDIYYLMLSISAINILLMIVNIEDDTDEKRKQDSLTKLTEFSIRVFASYLNLKPDMKIRTKDDLDAIESQLFSCQLLSDIVKSDNVDLNLILFELKNKESKYFEWFLASLLINVEKVEQAEVESYLKHSFSYPQLV